jgi:hypothetical protein
VGLAGHQPEVNQVPKGVRERQKFGRDVAAQTAYGLTLCLPFAPCPEQ